MKKVTVSFSLMLVLSFSLSAFAKQSLKKAKDNPIVTQCEKNSLNAPHPETWVSCCKAHGGKVKKEAKESKEGWDCDAESETKAKELASDDEDAELAPPSEESDEALGQ